MIKPIAIYLPQYHTIPENDLAWGEGFTEWTNVKKAKPLFEGHYQPHIPHESIGYYNLEDSKVLEYQAALAREYGIFGFAFYHYWFNGKRLLDLPIDNFLKSSEPNFPFCFIWANEPWSKRWDGSENEVIQEQNHSLEDDKNHIEYLCDNVFNDKRYIKIDNKPVFLIYRTELFPDIKQTVKIWRKIAKEKGFEDLYLVRVESFRKGIHPHKISFDAAMEFVPNWTLSNISIENNTFNTMDYPTTVFNLIFETFNYPIFRSVFPSWDNSPRKGENGVIFTNNTLDVFTYYLQRIIEYTLLDKSNKEKYVFINAWNEWGEGCHIEPDSRNGNKILEIIKDTISKIPNNKQYRRFLFYTKLIKLTGIPFLYNKIKKIKKGKF